jgi:hypothetical protein
MASRKQTVCAMANGAGVPRFHACRNEIGFMWNFADSLQVLASNRMEATMHGIIYLVGLIVVILAILSFFGLR